MFMYDDGGSVLIMKVENDGAIVLFRAVRHCFVLI